jgi:hypothetical protein
MSIMKIIGGVLLFFLIVSWLIYGFSPGNTWMLFVVFVFIAMAVVPTKIKGLFALVFLLLVAWFVFGGAGHFLEGVGNRIPSAVRDVAKKNVDNSAQSTLPGLLNQVTQAAQQLDQNDLNACLRVKAADAIPSNPSLGIGQKVQACDAQAPADFKACMKKNVFNGNVSGEVEDCEPSGIAKAGHLALATAYVGAKQAFGGICSATKFVNSHVPGVSLPTNYCPPS